MRERVELLDIEQEVRDVAVVVSAIGEVDSGTVETFSAALDSALSAAVSHPARVVVVELDGVTYFGSAGLNALLQCAEKGRAEGVAVRLVTTNIGVTRPMEVTKIDAVLPPYRTLTEALASLDDPR